MTQEISLSWLRLFAIRMNLSIISQARYNRFKSTNHLSIYYRKFKLIRTSTAYYFAIFISSMSPSAIGQDIVSVHCPLGCPSNPDKNTLVFAHLYALSNNPSTKFADWVAYEVDAVNFGPSPGRDWKTDPLLSEDQTLEVRDYAGANRSKLEADRGHQAPLASFAGSRYWSELNYLSNITPQDKDLNQGPWKALEDAVRASVSYRKSLFVITGPIYDEEPTTLPRADEPHDVPDGYFKVIYNEKGHGASFMMSQKSLRNDHYCSKISSINAISELTNLSFPSIRETTEMLSSLGCNL
mgnify:CR=1 FL=1